MALHRTQVAIVGGGMVGLALACALAKAGRKVAVIERDANAGQFPKQATQRVSAINLAAQQWLTDMGAWQHLPSERLGAYQGMHVWDHDSFGEITFNADDVDLPSLGTILENAVLTAALWQQAEQLGVTLYAGASIAAVEYHENDATIQLDTGDVILAQLVVAADGARSKLREQVGTPVIHRDYQQAGVVATIRTSEPHNGIARQAFSVGRLQASPGGPLALLPLADAHACSIVWSAPLLEAERLCALSEAEFNKELNVASNQCLGLLTVQSEREQFPLTMRYAQKWVYGRQVLVGDAAHTIHPLAGQGVNLGFGDAHLLAHEITELGTLNGQFDSQQLQRALRRYERARKAAAVRHIATMEGFHQLFTNRNPLVKLSRSIGLQLVNQAKPLKDYFLRQANQLD